MVEYSHNPNGNGNSKSMENFEYFFIYSEQKISAEKFVDRWTVFNLVVTRMSTSFFDKFCRKRSATLDVLVVRNRLPIVAYL